MRSVPAIDVVNTVALNGCSDTRHHIHFKAGGAVRSMTLADLDHRATKVAHNLHALGIRARDRVGIAAENRIEWVLLDLAVLKLGAVTAGFEPSRFETERLVGDYGLKLLFTDCGPSRGALRHIDTIGAWADASASSASLPSHAGYDHADICAIKFTSGSTGTPKGLEVTAASVNSSLAAVQEMFAHGDGDNILVFLRLALLQQRYWIYSSLVNGHDVTLTDVDGALDMAQAASPTVVMGVPGFYEELKRRLEATGLPSGAEARREAVQAQLGGRIRYLWTGSAGASRAVLEFFNDAGVPLYEGYGLNETCIVAKNHPKAFRLGSVGKVLPDKSVRFGKDGILLVASRYPVNCRYTWCAPGTNEKTFLPTAEVKTYDIGRLDEDGFLYIDGRVDDVLTLSSGRNVQGAALEHRLREHPDVHDCVVYGNGREFLSAVISPGSPSLDHASLRSYVERLNAGLAAEERIYGLVVAPERFSLDNGLQTSQFKTRRSEVHRRYADELGTFYEAASVRDDVAHAMAPMLVVAG